MEPKQTQLKNGYFVSTVWRPSIGLATDRMIVEMTDLVELLTGEKIPEDLRQRRDWLAEEGDYETRVFRGDGGGETTDWTELDSRRYTTETEALQGHDELVEKWSKQ